MKATCQNLIPPSAFKVQIIKLFTLYILATFLNTPHIYMRIFFSILHLKHSLSLSLSLSHTEEKEQEQEEPGGGGEEEEEECIRKPLFGGKSARLGKNCFLANQRSHTSNLISRQR
jgi:hypothetical protein